MFFNQKVSLTQQYSFKSRKMYNSDAPDAPDVLRQLHALLSINSSTRLIRNLLPKFVTKQLQQKKSFLLQKTKTDKIWIYSIHLLQNIYYPKNPETRNKSMPHKIILTNTSNTSWDV